MTGKTKAYLAAILHATIVGLSFLGTKTSIGITTPLLTLTWRYNVAFLGALVLIFLGIVRYDFRGKNVRKIFLPASMYVAFMGFQTWGLMRATSVEGSIIFAIVPIFTQILAFFILNERTVFLQKIFIALSVASVIFLYAWGSVGLGDIDPIGVLLLLIGCVCQALSNVFIRSARKDFRPLEVGCFVAILGVIFYNVFLWIQILMNDSMSSSVYFSPFMAGRTVVFVIAIVYLGIPCVLFTSSLMSYALARLEAIKGTIFANLSRVIGIIAGIIIRGEPFFLYHFIGAALIVIGVIGTNWAGRDPGRLKDK